MVKIALAGGSGNVASEIIDGLVANGKHDIEILTRKDGQADIPDRRITYVKVDYTDVKQLAQSLKGVHTVLAFMGEEDPTSPIQRALIDASIEAGVKRFLPSEWAAKKLDYLSWYAYKGATREYLKEINKDRKVLEYTLFQPGFFLNYLTFPYRSSKYVHQIEVPFDFNKRRAILVEGSEKSKISFITVQDVVNVIVRMIEYEGEWPVDGGVVGSSITLGDLLALGEKLRGGKLFDREYIKIEDVAAGKWTASWVPKTDHPSIPPEQVEIFSPIVSGGILAAISVDAYYTSDSWNKLLPDYKFTGVEEFLTEAWADKP